MHDSWGPTLPPGFLPSSILYRCYCRAMPMSLCVLMLRCLEIVVEHHHSPSQPSWRMTHGRCRINIFASLSSVISYRSSCPANLCLPSPVVFHLPQSRRHSSSWRSGLQRHTLYLGSPNQLIADKATDVKKLCTRRCELPRRAAPLVAIDRSSQHCNETRQYE